MMRAKVKKLFKCMLCASLLLTGFVFITTKTQAKEIPSVTKFTNEEEFAPYAIMCGICKKGTMKVVSTSTGEWYNKGEELDCVHHTYGTDLKEYRDTITQYKCSNCGAGYSKTTTETKRNCHGYN